MGAAMLFVCPYNIPAFTRHSVSLELEHPNSLTLCSIDVCRFCARLADADIASSSSLVSPPAKRRKLSPGKAKASEDSAPVASDAEATNDPSDDEDSQPVVATKLKLKLSPKNKSPAAGSAPADKAKKRSSEGGKSPRRSPVKKSADDAMDVDESAPDHAEASKGEAQDSDDDDEPIVSASASKPGFTIKLDDEDAMIVRIARSLYTLPASNDEAGDEDTPAAVAEDKGGDGAEAMAVDTKSVKADPAAGTREAGSPPTVVKAKKGRGAPKVRKSSSTDDAEETKVEAAVDTSATDDAEAVTKHEAVTEKASDIPSAAAVDDDESAAAIASDVKANIAAADTAPVEVAEPSPSSSASAESTSAPMEVDAGTTTSGPLTTSANTAEAADQPSTDVKAESAVPSSMSVDGAETAAASESKDVDDTTAMTS